MSPDKPEPSRPAHDRPPAQRGPERVRGPRRKRRPPRFLVHTVSHEIVLEVCERFLRGETVSQIAKWLKTRLPDANRQHVYPLVREAVKRKFLEFRSPPLDLVRSARIHDKYPGSPRNVIVVRTSSSNTVDQLARQTAERVLLEIKRLDKDEVHIGFGAGRTVKRVAWHLSALLRHEHDMPNLALHALGSGFSGDDASTSASSFFGFFHEVEDNIPITYHVLGATPFIPWDEYDAFKRRDDVKGYFKQAENMDIVVTTLNTANHEHGLLYCFMKLTGKEHLAKLKAAQWVGDVLWRPYSQRGPITEDAGIHAVTVFELHDLVRLAATPDKHVFMVVGPCPECRQDKSPALRPLLTEPSLRLCNHLVIDTQTADALLA